MSRETARAGRLLGYGRQSLDAEDYRAVLEALTSDRLTQGPIVPLFEAGLARATGAGHAVAVSNGTAALQLALLALGIGPGSRVLTSANTFLASATAALHCGAEVGFFDIDPRTMNLSPAALERELERGARVDAVVAVHFAGRPCELDALLALRRRHGFRLVVDACHALGAQTAAGGRRWRVGEHPGVDAAVLSFHPVKHITTGEGGAILCADPKLAAHVRRLASHGQDPAAEIRPFAESTERPAWFAPMVELGFNCRLTEIQAALGVTQLAKLERFLARRRELAWRYAAELAGIGGRGGALELPEIPDASVRTPGHAWHLYVVHAPAAERDGLMRFLAERGIGTQVHYYPVPLQPWFRAHGAAGSWPEAERHARTALSLPLHPALEDADQDAVLEALWEWARS